MKSIMKIFTALFITAFSFSLVAQDATIVLNYMKVNPGMESDYLEAEKTWKKIHENRIEAGVMTGWQLWRNVYATAEDPYQYITIDWYKDWGHSLKGDTEGFWEEYVLSLFTEEEAQKLLEITRQTRTMVSKEVMHREMMAENSKYSPVILVNRMKVKRGKEKEYMDFETAFAKPYQEEKINRGYMAHWGVWRAWPFKEGQTRYTTIDGYASYEQMTSGGNVPVEDVLPGKNWDELFKEVVDLRKQASVELWEVVDSVFPEAEEE